ncbi:MAG: hypothetical protein AAGA22_00620 [Pseudomonadota bacterium]
MSRKTSNEEGTATAATRISDQDNHGGVGPAIDLGFASDRSEALHYIADLLQELQAISGDLDAQELSNLLIAALRTARSEAEPKAL